MELSIEQFNSIPSRRARYTVLYVVSFTISLLSLTFYTLMFDAPEPTAEQGETADSVDVDTGEMPEAMPLPPGLIAVQALTIICLLLFYVQFIAVLRIMGYPAVMIACTCVAAFLPMPGLLVVAYVDRRISAVWHAANERLKKQSNAPS